MRTYLPAVDLRAPRDLDETLALLGSDPGAWKPFAGGTDLMVLMEAGTLPHVGYVSLWHLHELRGIQVARDAVTLGALTTYSDVLRHPVMTSEFPLVCRAAAETGGVATQNRGTIGGNIANASPAADTPPALLVYDAQLDVVSSRGTRVVAYHSFHRGYKKLDLAPDEIIARVRLPRGRIGWREEYRKVGTRRAQAISKVCFAGAIRVGSGAVQDVRLAFGSVAPTVVRCHSAENTLRGRPLRADAIQDAVSQLAREIAPIDDPRSTALYRLRVAQNLLREFLARSNS